MMTMTTKTSIIGGVICFALVLVLLALCPKDVEGAEREWTRPDQARQEAMQQENAPADHPEAVWSGRTEALFSGGQPEVLFSGEGILEFILEADFRQLKKDRGQESEDRPGRIILTGSAGNSAGIPLKVKTRGNFRLDRNHCSFPPLRLDLPKGDLQGTVLDGQNKLKLVTHCGDRDDYEQNLLEEYLAYRIYNLLTDVSLRVQLARVTYVDINGKMDPETHYAFLIESRGAMEARLGGTMLKVPSAHPDHFQPEAAGLMYLFQYLIGNVDFSIAYFHNVKVMRIDFEYFPVAYDFDWAGLVWAPYAVPHPELEGVIRNVRQRLFRGFCSDRIDYSPLFDLFNERRGEILALIDAQPGLTDRNVRSAQDYVEGFYEILNNDKQVQRKILDACRSVSRG